MTLNDKDLKLKEVMEKLSKKRFDALDVAFVSEIINIMDQVYKSGDYRHKYSSFFSSVSVIYKNSIDDFHMLLENIEPLNTFVNESKDIDKNTKKGIIKFIDHLNLEIARIEDNHNLTNEIERTKKELNEAKNELERTKEELNHTSERMEGSKSEMVTILSIFAAIILTFSGGLTLLGGAFTALTESPLLKTSLICIVCGLILLALSQQMVDF